MPTLNCGFTTRISGETDFPCISGERVGVGRVYVKIPADQPLDYDAWVQGLRDGRSYCCEGRTHLYNFEVNGLGAGEASAEVGSQPGRRGDQARAARNSHLAINGGQKLKIKCNVAGLLDDPPPPLTIQDQGPHWDTQPAWHIERARIKGARQIPVELIVNGYAVDKKTNRSGRARTRSRIRVHAPALMLDCTGVFPAAHTNPIFVEVDGKPIRASKRSAQWCIDAVETCWNSMSPHIRETERQAAREAYDHAKEIYTQIRDEAFDDSKP